MTKVYRCASEISFNLRIDGNKRRIIFDPMTGGRSQYRTNDPEVQKGIEGLDLFGSLIEVKEIIEEELGKTTKDEKKVVEKLLDQVEVDDDGKDLLHALNGEEHLAKGDETEKDIQEGIISFADAKEYLLTHGCNKTIRSREHIISYATELGIGFPNLK